MKRLFYITLILACSGLALRADEAKIPPKPEVSRLDVAAQQALLRFDAEMDAAQARYEIASRNRQDLFSAVCRNAGATDATMSNCTVDAKSGTITLKKDEAAKPPPDPKDKGSTK